MHLEPVTLVYYSPTGTTRRVVEKMACGVADCGPVKTVDITLPSGRKDCVQTSPSELLIVGVPVYGGRVAPNAFQWLRTMAANNTPAVCVVVYGNRAYDDALLELKETVVGVGCIPIALGAYIGEHSCSNAEAPVAKGRPDADDLKHAQSFGRRVRDKILSLSSIDQAQDIQVPGRHPLPPYSRRVPVSPAEVIAISDACLHCGTCAQACPASAIHPDTGVPISTALCTMCCACVRKCPVGARTLRLQKARDFAVRLSQWPQKQPEVFI